jgi:flagellar FliJ protein
VKRFRFKLEKLLEVRAFHERKAELLLAEKAGLCAVLNVLLEETARSRGAASRDMFSRGRDIADFLASEFYIKRLDRDRDRITEELARAELERETARNDYIDKRRSREAIDKFKERRQTEYYRLAEREETKILDDMARRRIEPARRPGASGPHALSARCDGPNSHAIAEYPVAGSVRAEG